MLQNATNGGIVGAKEAITMPILHVRGIPDDLYERVKAQAALDRRSLTAEVVHLLEQGLAAKSPSLTMPEWLEKARHLRGSLSETGVPFDSTEAIRRERERRTRRLLGE